LAGGVRRDEACAQSGERLLALAEVAGVQDELRERREVAISIDNTQRRVTSAVAADGAFGKLVGDDQPDPGSGTHSLQQLSSSPTVLTRIFGLLRVTQCV
jgi:hypothetical protein